MNTRNVSVLAVAVCLGADSALVPQSRAADSPARKVLFFSRSQGFEHSTIKKSGDNPSQAEKMLSELGPKHNIQFTFTKDGTVFTAANLAQYDAFFFYTTGDLTKPGGDNNPPMSPEGKTAFLEAIHNGKGFVGTHSATDTFHSPNYLAGDASHALNDGDAADPYIKMIGAEFIVHGSQQRSGMIVADRKFPGLSGVTPDFAPREEWYALKNFAPDLHVLLVQDTDGMQGSMYQRPKYPATWAHSYGSGRVFYTNMGHREDVWTNPVFQSVLMGGLEWAVGNVQADVTPNISQVTPKASETKR
jgi:type 1 glutamine amidotransferase